MSIVSRVIDFLEGHGRPRPVLSGRRQRREEARRRHRAADEPLWTAEDRHIGADGERWVADVSPGTPGHFGSVRTTGDD